MPLDVTNLKREFRFKPASGGNQVKLTDPNKDFTPAEVIQFFSVQYPELTTATIDGPKIENDAAVYEFKTTVGTKG